MHSFIVKFGWRGSEYQEEVVCYNDSAARKLIREKYKGCSIRWIKKTA